MEVKSQPSRVQRVRHEAIRREVTVARAEKISPNFSEITFTGDSLADFKSDSFDDHVKFMFTDERGELIRRDYTPKRYDAARRELTLEFGLHEGGLASDWARRAHLGTQAIIAGPRGSMVIPMDYEWHLLAGDASALPAISRRLEELPGTTEAIVIVQVADPADERLFQSPALRKITWLGTTDEFVSAVRSFEPPSENGFIWCAGEGSTMSQLRPILVEEKRFPTESMRVAAYWKKGAADFHESIVNPIDVA